MSIGNISSDINLGLPQTTKVIDSQRLITEFNAIYAAFRILQIELSAAKERITILETYNTTNP
jgi:hypothetical protein